MVNTGMSQLCHRHLQHSHRLQKLRLKLPKAPEGNNKYHRHLKMSTNIKQYYHRHLIKGLTQLVRQGLTASGVETHSNT